MREERIRRQAQEYKQQQEYIAKEEAFIRRYSAGQKAMQARGRETRLQRLERVQRPERDTAIAIGGLSASRTGQVVLSTRGLEVGFVEGETQTRLLSVPDLKLERGSRTALSGDNGLGKATLIKTIWGLTPPLAAPVDRCSSTNRSVTPVLSFGFSRRGGPVGVESFVLGIPSSRKEQQRERQQEDHHDCDDRPGPRT